MAQDKTAMYLVAIVGIVAAVALVILLMNVGSGTITGQASGYYAGAFADTYCPAHYGSTCAGGWTYNKPTSTCMCGGEVMSADSSVASADTTAATSYDSTCTCLCGKTGSCSNCYRDDKGTCHCSCA